MRKLSMWTDPEWSVFQDFDRLQGSMNRLLNDFGRSHLSGNSELAQSAFTPACEIQETTGHYVMSFDLPGVKKDEINIEIEDNKLTLTGERKVEDRQETGTYQRVERAYGKFHRVFTLPVSVDNEKIEANHENGVLTLVLPKVESAKPRQIKINEGRDNLLDRVFGKKPELKVSNDASHTKS